MGNENKNNSQHALLKTAAAAAAAAWSCCCRDPRSSITNSAIIVGCPSGQPKRPRDVMTRTRALTGEIIRLHARSHSFRWKAVRDLATLSIVVWYVASIGISFLTLTERRPLDGTGPWTAEEAICAINDGKCRERSLSRRFAFEGQGRRSRDNARDARINCQFEFPCATTTTTTTATITRGHRSSSG